jgi:hypothetical protein
VTVLGSSISGETISTDLGNSLSGNSDGSHGGEESDDGELHLEGCWFGLFAVGKGSELIELKGVEGVCWME